MEIVKTSDRVDVIRCKDCMFAQKINGTDRFCIWTNHYVDPQGYCSEAERRQDHD